MKELWFGGWQNFYDVKWPVRFLVELLIVTAIITGFIKIVKHFVPLEKGLIIFRVCIVKYSVYLIGRNRNWAVDIDNKITAWGNNELTHIGERKHTKRNMVILILLLALYFSATFVDFSVCKNFQEESLVLLYQTKEFFQKIEGGMSAGYENYAPLLKKEPIVFLQLVDESGGSAKIRRNPDMESKVISTSGSKIIYRLEWDKDGERYWLKVYLPDERKEGWLNGNMVVKKQLKKIISK